MGRSKVSIVVPVYNAERYLKKCVDSLLEQSYKNIEILLINDGSTDSSGEICDEYIKKHEEIKVIHKTNSGVSDTRNAGIDVASGEFIQFVDSDDFLESNMIERLVQSVNHNVQLAICGYKSIYMSKDTIFYTETVCPIKGRYQNIDLVKHFGELFNNGLINPLWNKLYYADLIKKLNLKFNKELNMGEDLLFNLEYINACDNIEIINEQLYNYLKFNDNSLTENFKECFLQNQQMLFSSVRQFLLENNVYTQENKKFIELSYIDSMLNCIENLFHPNSNLSSNKKRDCIEEIVYDDWLMGNIPHFKSNNLQKNFIAYLINNKSIKAIYIFFETKKILKTILR